MTSIGQVKFALAAILCMACAAAGAQGITLASTTSTEQSGLFAHLLPLFKQASGMDVKVVAVGTGQALDIARRGDADALLVHDQAAEEKFVAEGFGVRRQAVMYNDFVLIGPKTDPATRRGHRRRAQEGQRQQRRLHFARRQERHPWRRDPILDRRGTDEPAGQRLQGVWMRHGSGVEHCRRLRGLRAGRSRHLAFIQEPRRPRDSGRRR
jgi:hypothetical protein